MIIYNETVIVDEGIYKEWLHWMQTEHIPAVMAAGHFDSYQMLKVMDSPNEGVTYCVQYHTSSLEKYNHFNSMHQQKFQEAQQRRFENMLVMFNTLMQTVE